MRMTEVGGFEGVGRRVMGLVRVWKCVEKWGEEMGNQVQSEVRTESAR
jgi:hypothetical protein